MINHWNEFLAFFSYFGIAILLLSLSIFIYVKTTPINEFALVKANNLGAGISLSGAILGFTFPVVASIFFTHSLLEMLKWALVSLASQLVLVALLHHKYRDIEQGNIALALVVASMSVALGLLNAISLS